MHIHHIGYVVKQIEKALGTFAIMGFEKKSEIFYDSQRKIQICFMEKGGYMIELVSPMDKNSPFYSLLKRYQNAPYHICYQTSRFKEEIEELTQQNFMIFQPPLEAPAIGGKLVCFMMHPEIGMIELLEG